MVVQRETIPRHYCVAGYNNDNDMLRAIGYMHNVLKEANKSNRQPDAEQDSNINSYVEIYIFTNTSLSLTSSVPYALK